MFTELIQGLESAILVEDYPTFHKGPCVLVLQREMNAGPVHAVLGIPKNSDGPAVLVTAIGLIRHAGMNRSP